MKNFVLIGAAGFVAPRHMKAIKDTGNNIVAIVDPCDSVGVIDTYFKNAYYFNSLALLDEFLKERSDVLIDYYSICSPNYCHLEHVLFGLKRNSNVICEKPLVLNTEELELISKFESDLKSNVTTILQLRLHENVKRICQALDRSPKGRSKVKLKYFTPRGNWYHSSWKGDVDKSGGLAMNIGVHFFDLLIYLFGEVRDFNVEVKSQYEAKGKLQLEKADVEWHLSIDYPTYSVAIPDGQKTLREFTIDGMSFDFSQGFEDLHTKSYEKILSGEGNTIDSIRPSISLVEAIANYQVQI